MRRWTARVIAALLLVGQPEPALAYLKFGVTIGGRQITLKWADECLDKGQQPLAKAIARITSDAARVTGIASGQLSVGSVADVCIFDPAARWTVDAKALASQGKHTPFLGYEMTGQVRATIVAGSIAFER